MCDIDWLKSVGLFIDYIVISCSIYSIVIRLIIREVLFWTCLWLLTDMWHSWWYSTIHYSLLKPIISLSGQWLTQYSQYYCVCLFSTFEALTIYLTIVFSSDTLLMHCVIIYYDHSVKFYSLCWRNIVTDILALLQWLPWHSILSWWWWKFPAVTEACDSCWSQSPSVLCDDLVTTILSLS